jgi:hypothetical protein
VSDVHNDHNISISVTLLDNPFANIPLLLLYSKEASGRFENEICMRYIYIISQVKMRFYNSSFSFQDRADAILPFALLLYILQHVPGKIKCLDQVNNKKFSITYERG